MSKTDKKKKREEDTVVNIPVTEARYFATYTPQLGRDNKQKNQNDVYSTPINGTRASLISKAGNSFHKEPEAFRMTITLLLGP